MADITLDKLTLPTALRMPVKVRGYVPPQSRYPVRVGGFRPRPAKFDLSFDRGPFRITGTVKTKGTPHTPVRRRVVLVVERAGRAIAETWSDPTTGRLAFIDTGTANTNAALQIHSGTRPATANDATTDTLLVSVKLTSPAGSVADGALTLTPAEPGMVAATGVGTWARVVNRDGATVFDMDVGATGSTAECILTSTTLYAGGLVSVLSAVLG